MLQKHYYIYYSRFGGLKWGQDSKTRERTPRGVLSLKFVALRAIDVLNSENQKDEKTVFPLLLSKLEFLENAVSMNSCEQDT